MNLICSLLIYNPLESLIIILLLSFVSNKKLGLKSTIINSCILGTVNLMPQIIVEIFYGTLIYPILIITLNFIIYPLIIYTYNKYIIGFDINFINIFEISTCFTLSNLSMVMMLNTLSVVDVFSTYFGVYQELIFNLSVRIPQFIVLGIMFLVKRMNGHEKGIEENCRKTN